MVEVSLFLALICGVATAVPGLLPAAGLALVTWSRVVSGVGWLGYGVALALNTDIPVEFLPGLLAAQVGYGLAVVAIGIQACRKR